MEQDQTQIWQQALAIYADISSLSVQKAIAHVDSIHDLNFELKQVVVTLINAGNQASQYIEKNFTPDLQQFHNELPEYKLGIILGEYELIEKLGQGGMSQVFKAKRLESEPQKMVAIKIFSPRHNSPQLLDHFINEQKILAQFNHANIVDMLHGGKTDDTAYLVMELIDEAMPIDKYCKKHNLSIKQKISYISKCADALIYSHANLIIHRDLKPDNILINSKRQLKIVDFGIAKLINNDSDGNNTTIMALTPNYAAPEQINSSAITVKTDIFSLAVVALDLLCKGKPLPKDRLLKSCINDDECVDDNLKVLDADKDIKNILRKALDHNPDKRYANMQSFSDDIKNWLTDKPVNATSHSLIYQIGKFAKRRMALFATLMTLLITISLGFIIQSWQYHKTKIAEQKAIEVKNFMLDVFSYADPIENIGKRLYAYDVLNLAEDEIRFKEFSDLEIKTELLRNIGIAFVNIGVLEDGERNLVKSLEFEPNNLEALLKLTNVYMYQNDTEKVINILNQIEGIFNNKSEGKIQFAEYLLLKASVERDEKVAIRLAKESKIVYTESNNIPGIIYSTRILAEKIFSLKASQEPIDMCLELIHSLEGKVSEVNSRFLELKTSVVEMYLQTKKYELAEPIIDTVIASIREKYGNKHPTIINPIYLKIRISQYYGKTVQAIKFANEIYGIVSSVYGKQSKPFQKILTLSAKLEIKTADIKRAGEDLKEALRLSIKNYGLDHKITKKAQNELSKFNSEKTIN